jgi:hypothetical protein
VSGPNCGCECCAQCYREPKKPAFLSWGWWFDSPITVFTFFLVLVGAIQAYWLQRTVKVSEAAARAAGKSADAVVSQLRAYISIFQNDISGATPLGELNIQTILPLIAGTRPCSRVKYKNTGQTPAFDLVVNGNVSLTEWPLDPAKLPPIQTGHGGSKETLGPGMERTKIDITPPEIPPLTQDDIVGLTSGRLAIFVYGEMLYRDAFNIPRFTRYRLFTGGPTGIRGGGFLSAHDEGNEAN